MRDVFTEGRSIGQAEGFQQGTRYGLRDWLASPEAERALATAMAAHPAQIGMGHGASSCGTGCAAAVLYYLRNELFGEGSGT